MLVLDGFSLAHSDDFASAGIHKTQELESEGNEGGRNDPPAGRKCRPAHFRPTDGIGFRPAGGVLRPSRFPGRRNESEVGEWSQHCTTTLPTFLSLETGNWKIRKRAGDVVAKKQEIPQNLLFSTLFHKVPAVPFPSSPPFFSILVCPLLSLVPPFPFPPPRLLSPFLPVRFVP